MKKTMKAILLVSVLCFTFSMAVFAESKDFTFTMKANEYDAGVWKASKADGEQTAYVRPLSFTGRGTIFAAVYDSNGSEQYTMDVPLKNGDENKLIGSGYYKTGYAGRTYRIIAGDSEGMVTTPNITVKGRWNP